MQKVVMKMVEDLVPALLSDIERDFEKDLLSNAEVKAALLALKEKSANYKTVHEYAVAIGQILSKALGGSLSVDKLPDGKMYYNIAKRLLERTLGRNYELVSGYAAGVQQLLNEQANLRIKSQVPDLNQDKIDGLVNRLASEDDFDKVKWLLGDPIMTFTQSIVDDMIEKNAEFHRKLGMTPTISRESTGKCCQWCNSLVGNYIYGEEPKNFYRRHGNCRCIIDYHPKNGKRQNSWSKKWTKETRDVLERRKQLNIDVRDNNRKADIAEYKRIYEILGVEKTPISLAKFQDLKYNDSEKYEQLKDKVFINQKIKSGEWGSKINAEKQSPHMESTRKDGKSYLYDSIDVQKLFDDYYGTGRLERDRYGRPTNKEIINLNFYVGINASDNSEVSAIKIHHSKNRTHIVPKKEDS